MFHKTSSIYMATVLVRKKKDVGTISYVTWHLKGNNGFAKALHFPFLSFWFSFTRSVICALVINQNRICRFLDFLGTNVIMQYIFEVKYIKDFQINSCPKIAFALTEKPWYVYENDG